MKWSSHPWLLRSGTISIVSRNHVQSITSWSFLFNTGHYLSKLVSFLQLYEQPLHALFLIHSHQTLYISATVRWFHRSSTARQYSSTPWCHHWQQSLKHSYFRPTDGNIDFFAFYSAETYYQTLFAMFRKAHSVLLMRSSDLCLTYYWKSHILVFTSDFYDRYCRIESAPLSLPVSVCKTLISLFQESYTSFFLKDVLEFGNLVFKTFQVSRLVSVEITSVLFKE